MTSPVPECTGESSPSKVCEEVDVVITKIETFTGDRLRDKPEGLYHKPSEALYESLPDDEKRVFRLECTTGVQFTNKFSGTEALQAKYHGPIDRLAHRNLHNGNASAAMSGDKVMWGILTSDLCKALPEASLATIQHIRQTLECNGYLNMVGRAHGIDALINFGTYKTYDKEDEQSDDQCRIENKLVADAMEAIFGAYLRDSKYKIATVREVMAAFGMRPRKPFTTASQIKDKNKTWIDVNAFHSASKIPSPIEFWRRTVAARRAANVARAAERAARDAAEAVIKAKEKCEVLWEALNKAELNKETAERRSEAAKTAVEVAKRASGLLNDE